MRAVVYSITGTPEVLQLVEREIPLPRSNEVLVQIHVSGVNPTDWRVRQGSRPGDRLPFDEIVPNQDGAGVITAVGVDVPSARVGERVWLFESGWERANGTAQEYLAIDSRQAVVLPDVASFSLGASLGIPALTAHRCLTIGDNGPHRLGPGTMLGHNVLVAGGAGAVGHAAVQLAKWSGAMVMATVSSAAKAILARAAGADLVVNYHDENASAQLREAAPAGIDLIVEVNPIANASLNAKVLANNGSIAIYAGGTEHLELSIRPMMVINARYQFVYVYTVPTMQKDVAVADVAAATYDGALTVGAAAGLPIVRFGLADTPAAHQAVEDRIVGKVLIDVVEPYSFEERGISRD